MRLGQILMAPEGEEGGGAATDEVVTVPRAEFEALQALAASASSPAEAIQARDAAHAREIADRDRKAGDLERAYRSALRDREIATALAGKPLVAGAAAQLIQLWRDDFDVVDDGAKVRILARDGRGVEQAVADRLAGPEFAHFCLPNSRGGTGARGQNRSATPAPPPAGPRTLGEAAVVRWRDASPAPGPTQGSAWGRR